mgnify:CR=1 FL=1
MLDGAAPVGPSQGRDYVQGTSNAMQALWQSEWGGHVAPAAHKHVHVHALPAGSARVSMACGVESLL